MIIEYLSFCREVLHKILFSKNGGISGILALLGVLLIRDQYFLLPVAGSGNIQPILVKYLCLVSSTSFDP